MDERVGPLKLTTSVEQWRLRESFRIAGFVFEVVELLVVSLEKDGFVGRAEAAGVYYKKDHPASMRQQLESLRTDIEAGLSSGSLQRMLPSGGARNALDCALWDLRAKLSSSEVWQLAGLLRQPMPLLTTFTCGADKPERMAANARAYAGARAIKLKLIGEALDADRVTAVRDSLPDVWLAVDANQGFTRPLLERLMPTFVESRVSLIEQPLAIGEESQLEGFQSPIPIAADESIQDLRDMPNLVGRFNIVNIKLDKCGGLTEGLAIARAASDYGMSAMVGNMMGTSLGMAPAFLVGQLCSVVDLDGPVFLQKDRQITLRYSDGYVDASGDLWGGGSCAT